MKKYACCVVVPVTEGTMLKAQDGIDFKIASITRRSL